MPTHKKLLREGFESRRRRLAYLREYAKNLSPEQREQRRLRAAAWYQANKAFANEKNREWYYKNRDKNRDQVRNTALKRQYGITLAQKGAMYEAQKGLCDACNQPLPEDFRKADVDHNHITGRVRALLHRNCNTLVGREEKAPGLLLKILEYKKRWDLIEASEVV